MAEEGACGVVVPAELAALVDRLLGYGVEVLAARNGALPRVAALDGLRAQLHLSAVAARGGRSRTLVPLRSAARDLSVREAAQVMGLSVRHVRYLAATGALIARKRGRDWWIDADSADGYARRQQAWQQQGQRAA